nr:hypothetical protein [Haliscomenobacter sp.]
MDTITPPKPPAIPPMPTTEATAFLGNISDTVVKILALQAWCAEAPMPISTTGIQKLMPPKGCANNTTSGIKAIKNMARIRPS